MVLQKVKLFEIFSESIHTIVVYYMPKERSLFPPYNGIIHF